MADPMADMLKQIKEEVAAKKSAEYASKALAKEMEEQSLKSRLAVPSLGALGKVLQSVTSLGKLAATGLGPIGALLSGITGSLSAPLDILKDMADAIIGFVQLANPGAIVEFTLAMNDAMATLGGALTPILQGMTIAARTWGDSLAKMMPVLQPLFDEMGQYIVNIVGGWAQVFEAMAPLIELLANQLVPVLQRVAQGVAFFQGVLIELITTLAAALGIESKRFNKDGSSQGAAVRRYQTSSVEQFSKDLFAKQLAMLSKGGQGKSPEANLDAIRQAMEKGRAVVARIDENVNNLWLWFKNRKADAEAAVGAGDAASEGATNGALGSEMRRGYVK